MRKMCDIRTIGEFWGTVDLVPKPSLLATGGNYHFFKSTIMPQWEDAANRDGGKWSLIAHASPDASSATSSQQAAMADAVWLETLLACIGEQLGEDVCGCCVNVRQSHTRISLWTRRSDRDAAIAIGSAWKSACVPKLLSITFQKHGEQGFVPDSNSSNSPRLRL